jgi:hypothetical protein
MWTAQKNAFNHRDKFPEASDVIINSTIVDDHLLLLRKEF